MIIALFAHLNKKQALSVGKMISNFFAENNVKVVAEKPLSDLIQVDEISSVDIHQIDFAISLGGDGTILHFVHRYPQLQAPLLGVNLGNLGFLADINQNDIIPSLQELIEGRFTIQERLAMNGHSSNGNSCYAVNEIVLHRASNPSLIDLSVSVDGSYLNTFAADGLIISTPSGSTAYSMSAGGPILSPELEAFVLTPICPHTISNKPFVVMPKHNIQISYLNEKKPLEICYDGISTFHLTSKDTFSITPSQRKFRLVALERTSYFATLREKLGWQGKLRNPK